MGDLVEKEIKQRHQTNTEENARLFDLPNYQSV